jgi:hypothetical protein
MNNIRNRTENFIFCVITFCAGIFFSYLVINPIFELAPAQVERKIYDQAVDLGFGEWLIVKTPSFESTPNTRFRWITNHVVLGFGGTGPTNR